MRPSPTYFRMISPALGRAILLLAGLCVALGAQPAAAQDRAASREALVKAAMVYNFIRFIEWPDVAAETRNVCTLTGSSLFPAMRSIAGKPVGDASVNVRELGAVEGLSGCDVFVISEADGYVFEQGKDTLVQSAILTISDEPDFAGRGGIIGFVDRDGKIGFQVNVEQAEARGLKFSSRLLRLAEIVTTDGGK